MGINIRTKGAEGEREVARAMNSIVGSVLEKHGIKVPEKPVVQRNSNQSAVGGSDLSNPFDLAIEVKRHEQLSVNTWWDQCLKASRDFGGTPILIYRKNGNRDWSVVMLIDVPLGDGLHLSSVRATFHWKDFLQWLYALVDRKVTGGIWLPKE